MTKFHRLAQRAVIFALLTLCFCLCLRAEAFPMPEPMPLARTIDRSQVIVIARLNQFVQEPSYVKKPLPRAIMGREALIESLVIKAPGTYVFEVARTLKGQCDARITLPLPAASAHSYPITAVEIDVPHLFLLFLTVDATATWAPTDPNLPFIRLADAQDELTPEDKPGENVNTTIINLILASLTDVKIRKANTYLLQKNKVRNPSMVRLLTPYADDENLGTRNNVLYCLVVNQDVSAVARIAKLAADPRSKRSGTPALMGLEYLEAPEAVPELNQLLVKKRTEVRAAAMRGLAKIADRRSVVYLMIALRDPDPQNYIPYAAYAALHRLCEGLGAPQGWKTFENVRMSETSRLTAWWQDELKGKHLSPARPQPNAGDRTVTGDSPLENLHRLLFHPSTHVRQAAMTELKVRANQESVPYLILAMSDPDDSMAYDAYETLHRLQQVLGATKERAEFDAKRALYAGQIYSWWAQEQMKDD